MIVIMIVIVIMLADGIRIFMEFMEFFHIALRILLECRDTARAAKKYPFAFVIDVFLSMMKVWIFFQRLVRRWFFRRRFLGT